MLSAGNTDPDSGRAHHGGNYCLYTLCEREGLLGAGDDGSSDRVPERDRVGERGVDKKNGYLVFSDGHREC